MNIGDIRVREFIHPDSINVTVWEVEQWRENTGRYAKPGSCSWHCLRTRPDPFSDKDEAVKFAESFGEKVIYE